MVDFENAMAATAIADYLDRETTKIETLITTVRGAIERLQQLRTTLISAAVMAVDGIEPGIFALVMFGIVLMRHAPNLRELS